MSRTVHVELLAAALFISIGWNDDRLDYRRGRMHFLCGASTSHRWTVIAAAAAAVIVGVFFAAALRGRRHGRRATAAAARTTRCRTAADLFQTAHTRTPAPTFIQFERILKEIARRFTFTNFATIFR